MPSANHGWKQISFLNQRKSAFPLADQRYPRSIYSLILFEKMVNVILER
ncbi:MAG: hypothetical protein WCY63_11530 [Weeksellaceae bacterium]